MKQLLGLLALAAVGTACQPQESSTQAVAATSTSTPVPTETAKPTGLPRLAEPRLPSPVSKASASLRDSTAVPAGNLAPATVLRRYDLAAFWQGKYDAAVMQIGPLDGFFGHDYRRIAFFFTKVRRDSLQPGVYWVQGKTRFKKIVSSFVGAIRIESIAHLDTRGINRDDVSLLDVEDLRSVFTARASFEFREQPAAATAGAFTGTSYLDFFIDSEGKPHSAISMMEASPKMPAKGAGLLYVGQWVSYQSKISKPLLLSGNVFITAPAALSNFSIGERDPSFNPKYARLGWNDYWANDEWWADSPKPNLSL